ncbi:MAG: hypothetical protein SVP26_07500 [Chloroflexota bacterium]|nr:hypothetical protein [Chloroflexota bacterium]
MQGKSYFGLREWAILIAMAVASALVHTLIPWKSITDSLGIPGPAAGMAVFGGLIFVLWICLARRLTGRAYSAIVVSILIAAICLLVAPWYGITSPAWFSVFGILALLSTGIIVELTQSRSSWAGAVGGGLGNLSCLAVTWLAIGFQVDTWVPLWVAPLLVVGAVVSGGVGVWLAQGITQIVLARQTG